MKYTIRQIKEGENEFLLYYLMQIVLQIEIAGICFGKRDLVS